MSTIELTSGKTTIDQLFKAVDNDDSIVQLNRSCKNQVDKTAAVVEAVANGATAVYGVNTGFGKLSSVRIEAQRYSHLAAQFNFVSLRRCRRCKRFQNSALNDDIKVAVSRPWCVRR